MENINGVAKINKESILIIAILSILLLQSCKSDLTTITGNAVKDSLLQAAAQNKEVKELIKNKPYTAEIRKLTEKDKTKTPELYQGIEGELYEITYKTPKNNFLVILNEENALEILPAEYQMEGRNDDYGVEGSLRWIR